jgi:hypothetical protein
MAVQPHSFRPYLLFSFPVSRPPAPKRTQRRLDSTRDAATFLDDARKPEAQARIRAAVKRRFQTREREISLAQLLGELPSPRLGAAASSKQAPAEELGARQTE